VVAVLAGNRLTHGGERVRGDNLVLERERGVLIVFWMYFVAGKER
jgi:hypothetical protein